MRSRTYTVALLAVFFSFSCGKEQFASVAIDTQSTGRARIESKTKACSSFSLIKPAVDLLFLWDNSGSVHRISDETKKALNKTILGISKSFNTHILLAPLIATTQSDLSFISSDSTRPSNIRKIRFEDAADNLSFPLKGGSGEEGVTRASQLIKDNIDNGVFRSGAYLIIVLMSNGDDNAWKEGFHTASLAKKNRYINDMTNKLVCLRGHTDRNGCSGTSLNSAMMKFISIVPHSNCREGYKMGSVYKSISSNLYNEPMEGDNAPSKIQDHGTSTTPDSYDICNIGGSSSVFDGVNESIKATVLNHKYNYWPVAKSMRSDFIFDDTDPNSIQVSIDGKKLTRHFDDLTSHSSGFYLKPGEYHNHNTRYDPSPGEPFTGYMIKLYGDDRLVYPSCIRINTRTPQEYFGYIPIYVKPVEDTIQVYINGAKIDKSYWHLIKQNDKPRYFSSKNIRVQSRSDLTQKTPGHTISGYLIQLSEDAVYTNGDRIEVTYDPAV